MANNIRLASKKGESLGSLRKSNCYEHLFTMEVPSPLKRRGLGRGFT